MELIETPIVDLVPRLQERSLRAEALMERVVERIRQREPVTKAFAHFDQGQALATARARDTGRILGPLHGIPFAVKDIYDTADAPTSRGSPIYAGFRPKSDAAIVATLRAAGAIVVGKTVTTEFAYFRPGSTTNPHNPAHTPGGSSSGSAAAVADLMAPLALGTQTAASVIRPSSFCGVVGFKAGYGSLPLMGVQALAHSLDSPGWMTRSVEDAALIFDVLTGAATSRADTTIARKPRIGLCRTHEWAHAGRDVQRVFDEVATTLHEAGWVVEELVLPEPFSGLVLAQERILAYEALHTLVHERIVHAEQMSPQIMALLEAGKAVSFEDYRAAQALAAACRPSLGAIQAGYDALLAPSAPGEAPEGLQATGNPIFSRMWTLLHVPSLTLPVGRGAKRLPIGVQLIGRLRGEETLFAVARRVAGTVGLTCTPADR